MVFLECLCPYFFYIETKAEDTGILLPNPSSNFSLLGEIQCAHSGYSAVQQVCAPCLKVRVSSLVEGERRQGIKLQSHCGEASRTKNSLIAEKKKV